MLHLFSNGIITVSEHVATYYRTENFGNSYICFTLHHFIEFLYVNHYHDQSSEVYTNIIEGENNQKKAV